MLVQLSTVKTRLSISSVVLDDDALLTLMINAVGARFDDELNRTLARSATATYEFDGDVKQVVVDRYPIESVSAWHLKTDEDEGWVAQTDVKYRVRRNTILELAAPLGIMSQRGRVTFAGGYVMPGTTPGTGQTALPKDLENAALEQVVTMFQRRHDLGLSSAGGQGASLQKNSFDLLPSVAQVLSKHRRWIV